MRLDLFLSRAGILKRRTEAARLLRAGRVLVDGRSAKPAAPVRAGTRVRVQEPSRVREWEVLEVPSGSVPRAERARYVRLVAETPGEER